MKTAFDYVTSKTALVSTYEVSVHPDFQAAFYSKNSGWENNRHYLTILTSPEDNSQRLFFDYMEAESSSWASSFTGLSVSWNQKYEDFSLSGSAVFVHHKGEGTGSIQLGEQMYAATFRATAAKYSVDIAKSDKIKLTPTGEFSYDLNPEEWDALPWSGNTFKFQYHVEPSGGMGSETLYKTVMGFHDNDTGKDWETVYDMANPFASTCTCSMSSGGLFDMRMVAGKKPDSDDRSSLPKEKSQYISVFPNQFSIQFKNIFSTGTGAIAVEQAGKTDVYAVRLHAANEAIVGFYRLSQDDCVVGHIAVHRGKLCVRGKLHPDSVIKGNCLYWNNLKGHPFLPENGSIAFSPDGESVLPGNTAAYTSGKRVQYSQGDCVDIAQDSDDLFQAVSQMRRVARAEGSASSLNIYGLLNMDPTVFKTKKVTQKDGSEKEVEVLVDAIQDTAMDDFYAILKYYMPKDLREQFIGESMFIITDPTVKSIAESDENGKKWYEDLAVPYLTNALSRSSASDPYIKKLNAARAATYMQKKMSQSKIYESHSKKLFSYRWQCLFPLMKEYLADQKNTARFAAQNKDIDLITNEMIADLEKEKQSLKDADKIKMYNDAIKDLQKNAAKAKNGRYWAFMLYTYICNYYFPALLQQMISGNISQEVSMTIKRLSAIFEILDPSNEFNDAFVKSANFFQISAIMPNLVDPTQDKASYFDAAYAIIEEFLQVYGAGGDPDVQEAVALLYEMYCQGKLREYLEEYMDLYVATIDFLAPGIGFQIVAEMFQKQAIIKFSEKFSFAIRLFGVVLAAVGIGAILTGAVKWSDISATDRALLITVGSALVIEGALKLIRNGMECYAYYVFCGSRWQAVKSLVTPLFEHFDDALIHYSSSFSKWMLGRGKYIKPTAYAELFRGEIDIAAKSPRLTAVFGRNLSEFLVTRFAAILAIIGIVVSGVELFRSKDPLEKAMNSLFLAASILDLTAIVAGWIGGAASISAAGASVCGLIAGIATGFAILAVVAGLAILIVLFVKRKKQQTPVEAFCKNHADRYKLYMTEGVAAEHFVIGGSGDETDLTGVSISWNRNIGTSLHVRNDKVADIMALDYSHRSVLFMDVDENGAATVLHHTGDDKNTVLALTYVEEHGQAAFKMMPKDKANPDTQKWVFNVIGNEESGDIKWDNGKIVHAVFSLQNVYLQKQNKASYLNANGTVTTLSNQPSPWKLQFSGTKPYGLHYGEDNHLVFQVGGVAQYFMPYLQFTGSTPLVWTIDCDKLLPDGISLNKEGIFEQKEDAALSTFAPVSFVVAAQNKYGEASQTVKLEIKDTQNIWEFLFGADREGVFAG